MSYNTRAKRSAAIICALGISLAPAATGVAFAQDPALGSQVASIFDGRENGDLTIHKYLNPESTTPGTGNAGQSASGTPVSGVKFNVTRINADISTFDGFKTAASLTAPVSDANLTTETYELTTGPDGTVTQNLPIGAYYVTEDVEGSTPVANGQPVEGLIPATGFIVFVPMTNPGATISDNPETWAGTDWNYDVHVYPKNTNAGVDKKVEDASTNVGDAIKYTIDSSIPRVTEGNTLTEYNVVDRYFADELAEMTVSSVQIVNPEDNTVIATIPATDYEVSGQAPAADGRVQQVLSITTQESRNLIAENPTAVVRTVWDSTVLGTTDGVIENDAKLTGIIKDSNGNETPFDTPEDEVKTYMGNLKVEKFAMEGETEKPLGGAEFELYRCTDIENLGDKIELQARDAEGNPVGDPVSKWTTDAEGNLTITGLHVSDIVNDAPDTDEDLVKELCLKETKAPAGYELRPEPIFVPFAWEGEGGVAAAENLTLVSEVENVKSTGFKLPSTGGMGVGLIIAAGLGIMGLGAFSARRNSKKA